MIIFGTGLVNNLINNLPIELHIPGYRYCGPDTKLQKRLARGDLAVNPLDEACKEHDIAYSEYRENLQRRHVADRVLADRAWQRVVSGDASFAEKATALAVTNVMKAKTMMGMGVEKGTRKISKRKCKKRSSKIRKRGGRIAFSNIVKAAKKSMIKSKNAKKVITSALKAVKRSGGRNKFNKLRVLPLPHKVGGMLPLIPTFADLSALGALVGGATGVAKAVNDASMAKKQLEEAKRHNHVMEEVSLGKGLYLRPYKTGNRLRLHNENIVFGRKKKTSL